MTTYALLPVSSPKASRVSQLGTMAARVVGPIAFALAVVAGGSFAAQPAEAAGAKCGDRDKILEILERKHEETPQALGLSADGGVLEVLVSPEGGWTILVTYPERPTCIVAVGKAWQSLTHLVGQGA